MEQEDRERFHSISMANDYNQMCRLIVQGYDFMQDTLIDILKFEKIDDIVLLDLGAGSGILIEKVLNEFPDSICYYLDYSNDFKAIAQKKLQKFEDGVIYVQSDFCDEWESEINELPNVITSSSAIHHLLNKDKKKLYNRCYKLLDKNGWFFNIDEMKTLNKDAYLKSLYFWIYHAEKLKDNISDDLSNAYVDTMKKFDMWKKRNVDNIRIPKQEGDDIHESFLIQLDWLEEIGFKNTDLFCKLFLWSMIGGKK